MAIHPYIRHLLTGCRQLAVAVGWLVQTVAAPVRRNLLFCLTMLAIHFICVWRQTQYEGEVWLHTEEVIQDLYIICLVLTLLPAKWGRRMRRVLYVAAFVLAGFEVFLTERLGMLYTPTALQLLSETNPKETSEFFMAYFHGPALWRTLALFGALALLVRVLGRKGLRWAVRLKLHWLLPLLNVAVVVLLVVGTIDTAEQRRRQWNFFTEGSSMRTEKAKWETFYSPAWRLAWSWHMLHVADDELEVLRQNMRRVSVDSCSARCPNIVLVIGESYNKYHSQLYGYRPKTTPHQLRMQREGSLVAYPYVVSCWNMTSNVFKNALSTHSLDQKGSWADGVLFPALFRKAGYRVAFLTNQFLATRRQHGFDFNGSFFLNDPELDTLCFDHRNTRLYRYDRDFIREYERYRPAGRNLIIFHLYGQHEKYSYRLGKDDVYFTADSVRRRRLKKAQKQVVADYDNATRYNDDVIRRICDYFKDDDAILLYLADHGEEVLDFSNMEGRTPAEPPVPIVAYYEFGVPFEFWFSPKFKASHPDVVNQVQQAKTRRFMTDDLPHLMMGLAGIHSKYYNPRRDLLHQDFDTTRRRLLKGLYDYDKLVKGTPFDVKARYRREPETTDKNKPSYKKIKAKWNTN